MWQFYVLTYPNSVRTFDLNLSVASLCQPSGQGAARRQHRRLHNRRECLLEQLRQQQRRQHRHLPRNNSHLVSLCRTMVSNSPVVRQRRPQLPRIRHRRRGRKGQRLSLPPVVRNLMEVEGRQLAQLAITEVAATLLGRSRGRHRQGYRSDSSGRDNYYYRASLYQRFSRQQQRSPDETNERNRTGLRKSQVHRGGR